LESHKNRYPRKQGVDPGAAAGPEVTETYIDFFTATIPECSAKPGRPGTVLFLFAVNEGLAEHSDASPVFAAAFILLRKRI
jgi:hypothetical protein